MSSQSSEHSIYGCPEDQILDEENRSQVGNHKLTAGTFGSQLTATTGGTLALSNESMDGVLPKTPEHSVDDAAPTYPSIASDQDDDSDDGGESLNRKQQEGSANEVTGKENGEEEEMGLESERDTTDNGTGGKVTAM